MLNSALHVISRIYLLKGVSTKEYFSQIHAITARNKIIIRDCQILKVKLFLKMAVKEHHNVHNYSLIFQRMNDIKKFTNLKTNFYINF